MPPRPKNASLRGRALAIAIPIHALAAVVDIAAPVDEIGVVIIAHPAPVLARIGEAIGLPVVDVELVAEPEGMDEIAAGQPAREAVAGPEMGHADAAAPAAANMVAAAPLTAARNRSGEPAAHMRAAADMLKRIRDERGITVVWVEHIMGVLLSVVDRVVVLDHGAVIFEGTPQAAQRDERVAEVYLGPPESRAA